MSKLYQVNISNNSKDFNDFFQTSYFFNVFTTAKKFANKKYDEIYETFGNSCEKINDKNYYIYRNRNKDSYFQIKIDEINLNSNNNNKLFECGKTYQLDKESVDIKRQKEINESIYRIKLAGCFWTIIIIIAIIIYIYYLNKR
jgi:hypothetical protein